MKALFQHLSFSSCQETSIELYRKKGKYLGEEMVVKIISGGQTGVDRAALDAAISLQIPHGGFVPAGRITEEGPLDRKYDMEELSTTSYPARTKKNVAVSDGTLILTRGRLTGGSALTEHYADVCGKPCLHIELNGDDVSKLVQHTKKWLIAHDIATLNVAGPRASTAPGIYEIALKFVTAVLQEPSRDG